ncbi:MULTISPECIES: beta-glucosidase BglX [Clostridium]|uniref:beta-glucosidase n=1 Tax=Clostridium carnis TaxID=1530 RepID=A0ABY6SXG3_9CLOT|nr:beta-glucosidase BglX [Clostridium carnis]CAI3547018.1 Periplasmic beta-glucosidase [Clostridium neonatale]CAI3555017.1 Periplasmic beta-glucosidase [Clostridium neonatale]CAI3562925.1 Periplasmic beta-glucosidase [Clostridium neonatale]CAI3657378.1 Periplasmic beta-glucosidase [Clostridium neonatale]CAI3678672.1 Periplasmic beta-glucosidase [Clostridium neonatale]
MEKLELQKIFEDLTLKEKIYQLVQLSGEFFKSDTLAVGPQQKLGISQEVVDNVGSVFNIFGAEQLIRIQKEYLEKSRHKIPLLFMADIINGYKTTYPIPLALGCTWNPDLIKKGMQNTAEEAAVSGIHVTFSPMVDLVRDARWGRVMESTGEDTYLNCEFAKAFVEGYQGDLDPNKNIASCVKHFAAYGAPEGGREYNTVDMSERRLREDYLPAYKAAVDSGCELVMTSFNTVDGIPASGNKWLMRNVLREEWGFNGIIISDYAAIQELIAHGVAEDDRDAAKLGIEAGVDIDMKTPVYSNQLEGLVNDGVISEKLIDEAVWRILNLKNKLGLFENPYRGADVSKEKSVILSPEKLKLAREISRESIVLLENNGVLPISKDKKIAIIGPHGESKVLSGSWAINSNPDDVTSLVEAVKEKISEENLMYAKGCEMTEDNSILGGFGRAIEEEKIEVDKEKDLEEALKAASKSEVVVMALGEHYLQSGEGGSRTEISLEQAQVNLIEKVKELGKPIVLVLFNGRPLVLTNVVDKVDAIIEAWFPGTEGGRAVSDVLFGDYNPSGRLTMSFPRRVGQVPLHYNEFNTGRPVKTSIHNSRFTSRYIDVENTPLYPFGYGLSYTKFEYGDIKISSDKLTNNSTITASIKVKNVGDIAGYETVQLYIQDIKGSVVRPVKELKGFKKVKLESGEEQDIEFVINEEMLRFYTSSMEFKSEEGRFKLYIGSNSDELQEAEFELI